MLLYTSSLRSAVVSYRISFCDSCEHDNNWYIILPYHSPEILNGSVLWSLCGNILCGGVVSLSYKKQFYLTMHSNFIYGYMTLDIIKHHSYNCRHYMGNSFRLTARGLLYAPPHRQDSTYHGLCYTNRGALANEK